MDASNIMIYAGRCLEKKNLINSVTVQKYIYHQPEVAVAISLDEIEQALGFLVTAGFIEVVEGDEGGSVYKRLIPEVKENKKREISSEQTKPN